MHSGVFCDVAPGLTRACLPARLQGCCNAFAWAPASPHVMTGGSDGTMLLWDVTAAEADGEVRSGPGAHPPVNSPLRISLQCVIGAAAEPCAMRFLAAAAGRRGRAAAEVRGHERDQCSGVGTEMAPARGPGVREGGAGAAHIVAAAGLAGSSMVLPRGVFVLRRWATQSGGEGQFGHAWWG